MSFLNRLATLAKADAHGVVDALEDKALLLRQHVREAGEELERKRSRIAALDTEEKDLVSRAAAISAKKASLDDDVRLALAEGEDDLARFAIKKLLPLDERLGSIGRRRETLAKERAELQEELGRQEAEYDELKERVRGYLASHGKDEPWAAGADGDLCGASVADEEVELELLRRKKAAVQEGGG
jgi:phage shock protein A